MTEFNLADYSGGLAALMTDSSHAPLDAGAPNHDAADGLAALDLDAAFAPATISDRRMAQACHSGLWLLHNFLDESHVISQDIDTITGSFWHGIMHRREGDFSNAKYWFRRVGGHPVYESLAAAAHAFASESFPNESEWDPFDFVDRCEAAVRGRSADADTLGQVARLEWNLLFDFCFDAAIGQP
ncbi:MAG: hypothetical protein VX988_00340 [Planctomycetota bacterium]|nr:hypothetical protein [Planctomycetota bacterium]MEE3219946.1 hypothetical protein [Planctomycetota bacterium]